MALVKMGVYVFQPNHSMSLNLDINDQKEVIFFLRLEIKGELAIKNEVLGGVKQPKGDRIDCYTFRIDFGETVSSGVPSYLVRLLRLIS